VSVQSAIDARLWMLLSSRPDRQIRMMFRGVLSRALSLPAPGAATLLFLVGCGPITYSIDIVEAEHVVAAARDENASYYAPYDLYFAEAQLDEAHEEAAEGQYEDAIHAVAVALLHGRRALTRSAQPGVSNR
jgi:Domain of unknown function (DUF4398)